MGPLRAYFAFRESLNVNLRQVAAGMTGWPWGAKRFSRLKRDYLAPFRVGTKKGQDLHKGATRRHMDFQCRRNADFRKSWISLAN